MTHERKFIASLLTAVRGDEAADTRIREMLTNGELTWKRGHVDTSYRGCGNKALRRSGETIDRRCGCVICVEYGGDCSYVMMQEARGTEHRAQRGVKTRLARRERIVFVDTSNLLSVKMDRKGEPQEMFFCEVCGDEIHDEGLCGGCQIEENYTAQVQSDEW